jgi:ribosome-associated translation inhibitor RaiA
MNIEINTPPEGVKEWVPDYVKNKLIEIHHQFGNISNFHISFKKHPGHALKTCEIELEAYGDSLFISKEAESYEMAMRQALNELLVKIEEWIRMKDEPPEETISTVNV